MNEYSLLTKSKTVFNFEVNILIRVFSTRKYFLQFESFSDEQWQQVDGQLARKRTAFIKAGQICHSASFINKGIVRTYNLNKVK